MYRAFRVGVMPVGILALSILLLFPYPARTQQGHWTRGADMPTVRTDPAAAVVDGRIYIIGGSSVDGSTSAVEAYDPMTDTWTTRADMPTPRRGLAAAAVDGKIYAIG